MAFKTTSPLPRNPFCEDNTEEETEDWHRSIDLNMKSAVMGSKYAIPAMEKSGGGSIINVSSIDGTQAGSTRNVPYSISKAAISHLSRIMAVHHGRQNIRVNCVAPGHVYGAFPNRFKKMDDEWRDLRQIALDGQGLEKESVKRKGCGLTKWLLVGSRQTLTTNICLCKDRKSVV